MSTRGARDKSLRLPFTLHHGRTTHTTGAPHVLFDVAIQRLVGAVRLGTEFAGEAGGRWRAGAT